ncbi:hypothetical protein CGRA01v4_01302 [Colletotrichum graminicola]|nr:hypothetical protein CGRA01v4_01302 [Colletotrichum graminicola]
MRSTPGVSVLASAQTSRGLTGIGSDAGTRKAVRRKGAANAGDPGDSPEMASNPGGNGRRAGIKDTQATLGGHERGTIGPSHLGRPKAEEGQQATKRGRIRIANERSSRGLLIPSISFGIDLDVWELELPCSGPVGSYDALCTM